jgi:hypothetical protein
MAPTIPARARWLRSWPDTFYVVTGGSVTYDGQDLLDMEPEIRAPGRRVPRLQYR